jgi:hypothetical protein
MEAQGDYCEAYEHSLGIGGNRVPKNTPFREKIMKPSQAPVRAICIIKLEMPLDTLQKVRYAAGWSDLLAFIQGIGRCQLLLCQW